MPVLTKPPPSLLEAAVYRAKVTTGCLASALHTNAASLDHANAVVFILDDLEGIVDP